MDLDLKEIIFDAYERGKLSIIIPFVRNIFEQVSVSKVFHPNNPWINGILTLLNEIKAKQNLKAAIGKEIEDLFKKLKLDPNSFQNSKLLDNKKVSENSKDFVIPVNSSIEINSEPIQFKDIYEKVL